MTREDIEHHRTPNGGWTKAQLAKWGVSWPPPKGWKERLLRVSDENRNGENAERSRGEALPARCHEMVDALTPSPSPKEQKKSNNA